MLSLMLHVRHHDVYLTFLSAAEMARDPSVPDWGMGRAWWYWRPHAWRSRGRLRRAEVTELHITWLCLMLSLTVWPPRFAKRRRS